MDRPNVLWICTDQQRYDAIGALGNPAVSTPNIDGLVESGVVFTHAYCQSPICTPSRASFLTVQYPSTLHVNGNDNRFFPAGAQLVTRVLADAGYDCGLVGKLQLASAFQRVEPRTDDGYRYWQYRHAPRDDWPRGHDYTELGQLQGRGPGRAEPGPGRRAGRPAPDHLCAEKTIDFIRQDREGPWLASVNIYDPHAPFDPPRQYREQFDPAAMPDPLFRESDLRQQEVLAAVDFQSRGKHPDDLDIPSLILPHSPTPGLEEPDSPGGRDARTLKAAYYAMEKLIDDQVGRMLAALEESGQRRDTVVIFTSDHGETMGDHGLIMKGCRFYEGLVRVPLVFSCPGLLEEGLHSDALVALTDKAPTLLELAGEEAGGMQGRSLLSILTGVADPGYQRDFVRSEYYNALAMADGTHATMYRDARHKLVVYHGHGELYDLKEDPREFDNLWDESRAQPLLRDLIHRSFDASMLVMDQGPERIGPM